MVLCGTLHYIKLLTSNIMWFVKSSNEFLENPEFSNSFMCLLATPLCCGQQTQEPINHTSSLSHEAEEKIGIF